MKWVCRARAALLFWFYPDDGHRFQLKWHDDWRTSEEEQVMYLECGTCKEKSF